ncbi:MAG: Fe-S protein assembly co-chaperone HscB [Magnetococcales bacterium]|nr:Fe-S protein assembly co-chaperone HscB [Magnetococcales bacterium]MBF0116213.1 Fe-S protein assembly co-chaperone HscB [Magnetococcales bacterium]
MIQPVAAQVDFFALFSLSAAFDLDAARLQQPYQDLQRAFHPDRFVQRSATERRLSLEQVTHLNRAYQTVKDPLLRSEYLLERSGQGGAIDEKALNREPAFLMEVMEQREALEEVEITDPQAMQRLQSLRREADQRIAQELAALRALHGATAVDWQAVARCNHRLRYQRRFLEAMDQVEEQLWQQDG